MKLQDLTTRELQEAVKATEHLAGRDSRSAAILRRELQRRTGKPGKGKNAR
jgi:hypothetical protein